MTTESTVRTVLASEFEEFAVEDCVRVGQRHTVYAVTVDGRRAACKVTDCQPATLAREGAVLRAVTERTSVPAPEVLASTAFESGVADSGEGVLVLQWVEGDRFDERSLGDQTPARLSAVGRALARLHDATEGWFDGHGPLRAGADPHRSVDGPLAVDGPQD